MNKAQAEIVIGALEERHAAISEQYAGQMRRYGELALSADVLTDLRLQAEKSEANAAIATDFLETLHQPEGNADFLAATPDEANAFQSSAIWVHNARVGHGLSTKERYFAMVRNPYYLIGSQVEQVTGNNADVSLLLLRAAKGKLNPKHQNPLPPNYLYEAERQVFYPTIMRARAWLPDFTAIQSKLSSNESTPLSAEQIAESFDPETKAIRITPITPHSISAMNRTYADADKYPRARRKMSDEQRRESFWENYYGQNKQLVSAPIITGVQEVKPTDMTDELMVTHDVFSHLGDIATRFGKKDALLEIIAKRARVVRDPLQEELDKELQNAQLSE